MKAITLLGSTGSIGTQTLDIVQQNPNQFRVVGLASGRNGALLAEQIRQFRPEIAAICDPEQLEIVKGAIADLSPQPILLSGEEGIVEVVARKSKAMTTVKAEEATENISALIGQIRSGKIPTAGGPTA